MARKRAAPAPSQLPAWVGLAPHRVWVGPRAAKRGVVYLRWWRPAKPKGQWRWKSLKFRLEATVDRTVAQLEEAAYAAAVDQAQRLSGRRAAGDASAVAGDRATGPLLLGEAWAKLTHRKTGRYPSDSVYRREIHKAIGEATRELGADFPLHAFDHQRLREVTRAVADRVIARKGTGFRVAQMTGTRLLTVIRVLKADGHIAEELSLPDKSWHAELERYCVAETGDALPAPNRPRYTIEEFRKLLAVAPQVDPRFGLLVILGAELRPGQVARARRSHLNADEREYTSHGRGKKGGTTIMLTPGQWAHVEEALERGYLRDVEAHHRRTGEDYLLLPGALDRERGDDRRAVVYGPKEALAIPVVGKTQIRKWQRRAEELAGIPHVDGRSFYGGRRTSVDGSLDEGISESALENIGGWTDARTPKGIYRDRGRRTARREAMLVRAKVRGELLPAAAARLEEAVVAPSLEALDACAPELAADVEQCVADGNARDLETLEVALQAVLYLRQTERFMRRIMKEVEAEKAAASTMQDGGDGAGRTGPETPSLA